MLLLRSMMINFRSYFVIISTLTIFQSGCTHIDHKWALAINICDIDKQPVFFPWRWEAQDLNYTSFWLDQGPQHFSVCSILGSEKPEGYMGLIMTRVLTFLPLLPAPSLPTLCQSQATLSSLQWPTFFLVSRFSSLFSLLAGTALTFQTPHLTPYYF